jgi:hypothetical protein
MLNYSNIDISSGTRNRNCINIKRCIILSIFIIIAIIGGYLYQEEKELKISIKNNLRNLEENLTSVYIETFSDFNVDINDNFKETIEDFNVNINDNFKETIEDFKEDINDNFKGIIEKLEIPMKENNKYVSTIKNIMIKNKIDEILMDTLNINDDYKYKTYYERIKDINLNFKHCFPASNIYTIFESLIDIDYENNIFSFNYDNETDTEENELDNIKQTSKLAKIINENLNINNYTYLPCDKTSIISLYNFENIKYYKNKRKCNFGYFDWRYPAIIDSVYSDNERYYFIYNNAQLYSTINSLECLSIYDSEKQKYTYDRTYSSYNLIGKILHNAIESIDLPIIKPIKFI